MIKRNDVAKKPVELERLQMAINDNIVTPEVKANGYGGVDMRRLDKSIDQIGADLRVQERQAEGRRHFRRLVPAGRGRPQGELTRRDPGGCRVRVRRARWGQPRLWRRRTDAPAVEGLSIAIEEGEFAAVVGPSGCGKSTLMKLATGLQFPFKGTVKVAGELVSQPVKIAGMAFQAPTLLPWRTTLENLLLPLEIVEPHRSEIAPQARRICRARREPAGLGRPCAARAANFPGNCPAACSSAPRSAAR